MRGGDAQVWRCLALTPSHLKSCAGGSCFSVMRTRVACCLAFSKTRQPCQQQRDTCGLCQVSGMGADRTCAGCRCLLTVHTLSLITSHTHSPADAAARPAAHTTTAQQDILQRAWLSNGCQQTGRTPQHSRRIVCNPSTNPDKPSPCLSSAQPAHPQQLFLPLMQVYLILQITQPCWPLSHSIQVSWRCFAAAAACCC